MKHLILLSLLLPFLSCSEKPSGNVESFWDDLDVVAEKVVVDGDSAILCDYNKVKGQERKTIPFAELFEDYEVVKLDNEDERAFLSAHNTEVLISDNYIGVYCYEKFPFKLFRRSDGKYLRDIGGYGQGPGEYSAVQMAQIDEEHNRIYILPALLNKLFIYDLEGTYLSSISLSSISGWEFRVDSENERIYLLLTVGAEHSAFLQVLDMEGHVLQELSSEKYDVRGTNPKFARNNASAYDIYIYYSHISFYNSTVNENTIYANQYDRTDPHNVVDFLCHYLPDENRLSPQFGIKNLDDKYNIYEFLNQFVVETLMDSFGVPEDKLNSETIIVDKATGKGCRFDGIRMPSGLLLKMYTGMRVYCDGYLLANVFGSELDRQIEKLDRSTLTSSEQKELERLESMIHDGKEDCNIIFIAKMKEH